MVYQLRQGFLWNSQVHNIIGGNKHVPIVTHVCCLILCLSPTNTIKNRFVVLYIPACICVTTGPQHSVPCLL